MKHGESTLPTHFRPRVPVAGTLKIGDIEERAGKSLPKKLDHLRFCGPSATASGQYPDRPDMAAENKAKAKAVTVELVSDEPAVNLEVAYVMAGRGHVLCRGNGIKAERRMDAKGIISPDQGFRPLSDGTCGESCPFFRQGKCKLASTLRFRIPERTDLGSVWQFRSTSWNTAQDLLGAMAAIKELTGGILARIPLRLFMTEQRRNPLTDTGRTSSSFWTLGLSYQGTETDLIEAVRVARDTKSKMDGLRIPTLETRLASQSNELLADLPASEERAVAAEFFPGPTGTDAPAGEAKDPSAPEESPVSEAPPVADATDGASDMQAIPSAQARAQAPAKPSLALLTTNQAGLIRRHSGRVKGIQADQLEGALATMTKADASTFITRMMADADAAFGSLGVVA